MASVNLALDEIITSQKQNRGGGRRRDFTSRRGGAGGPRRGGGSFRREKYFSDDTPAGKWKHDKFGELYGGGSKKRGAAAGSPAARRPRTGGRAAEIVKLNISNLPDTVVTSDVEELFQEFGVYGVAVHYDEAGQHLGTADLFVDHQSARDIIREYSNIAIDGQEINIAYVDESGALKPRIQDRVRRVASNPIRRRKERRSSPPKRRGARGGKVGGGGSQKAKQMTVEELDKELESYMGKKA
ncbi:aly/REF export factor 2 [Ditylenchus destructor]|uniref:Aly/REF export factor 2 n=1 Tax=Ditylenchus destructor TaxID=166010 RepID=A0AAD4NDV0_9BILA|nr:aly/REF export factor 2 [Ditylenchus destructor]